MAPFETGSDYEIVGLCRTRMVLVIRYIQKSLDLLVGYYS